ncbi:sulfatase-like hydrolase/transferase [Rhizobium rosettiformans]|uniref:sulfatase-like hydrolase/transferase n=1 Tax=Rhizobium rosettiformans TaxID=1368430 RepID=UPI0028551C36|nr:sulfatase-like hydrolase/transferase [Rhizobium rosettiformans]MDR7029840.1 hypothetical protein [Rhizobium rosettiformans]MDR7063554.1 hypothetical protein [Rhizobium rosettiformans]
MFDLLTRRIVVLALSVVGAGLLIALERDHASVPFALAVVLTLTVLSFALTRRVAASLLIAWGIVFLVAAISLAKQRLMGFNAHVFDLLTFAADAESVLFVLSNYWKTLLPLPVGLLVVVFLVRGLVKADRPQEMPSRWRLAGLVPAFALLFVTYPRDPGDHGYYMGGHFASAFFVSLADASFLFEGIDLTREVAAREMPAQFDDVQTCGDISTAPDVYVVHMESMFPPTLYPDWKYGGPDGYLARETANWRPLRVETFAGASWTTTFSLMTGLPAIDFGWMRPYLPIFMAGNVQSSLPLMMETCGYRTLAVMPTRYEMVNEGPFLKSIGFQEVYDRDDVGANSSHARDKVFYDFTTKLISAHRAVQDPRPLFVFLQTMTTHGPYDQIAEPGEPVTGMPFGNRPDIDEFLRRMTLARQDYRPFLAFVDKIKGKGGAVVLEYGDHQPSVSQSSADLLVGGEAAGDWNSPLYETYYDVHTYGRDIQALPSMTMDVGFLGATLAKAAGLPTNEVQRALLTLRDQCAGSYHFCPNKGLVFNHLSKLVASDLLTLP